MAENLPNGQKTLLKKETLLATSNFSLSLSVFKRLFLQTCKKPGLVWERVNISKGKYCLLNKIKVLKALVWHLSRIPECEIHNLQIKNQN